MNRAADRGFRRWAWFPAALVVLASLAWVFRAPLFRNNLHAVIPGEVYRSAQPSPEELRQLVATLGLRSVVSVRGGHAGKEWFAVEQRVLDAMGVELHSVRLSAHRWPSRSQLEELTRILETAPRPLLLHCRRGVDRSGLVSAMVQLLAGRAPERALDEYGLRHAHVDLFAPGQFREVVLRYADWLAERGATHSPERFRGWIRTDYVADFYSARIEVLSLPEQLAVGEPAKATFRVANTSPSAWTMRSEGDIGVSLGMRVATQGPHPEIIRELRSRPNGRSVGPGESRVLEVDLPPFETPGRYAVTIDMVDELVAWFEWMGSTPRRAVLEVRANPAPRVGSMPEPVPKVSP
jgi:protein tyrosine phosphatase (PTP) superfamily phosphohydrolase (DUF442 family)